MSADFFTVECINIGLIATQQQVQAAINSGAIDNAIDVMASNEDFQVEVVADEHNIDMDSPEGPIHAGRLTAIQAAKNIWWTHRTDMSAYHGMIQTGGISHGDNPTDAYDYVSCLCYIDEALLEALNLEHPNPRMRAWHLVEQLATHTSALSVADAAKFQTQARQLLSATAR